MTRMRLLAANLYVKNQRIEDAAKTIRLLNPHVAAVCEVSADHRRALERLLPDFRGFYGQEGTGLLVRDSLEVTGWGHHRLTERLEGRPAGIGGPREVTEVDVVKRDGTKWTAISVHGIAVPRKVPIREDSQLGAAAVQYQRGMFGVAYAAEARGCIPLPLGDFNDAPFGKIEPWEHVPTKTLPAHGFAFMRHRVDYLAYPEDLAPAGEPLVVPRSKTGSDHDWLYGEVLL